MEVLLVALLIGTMISALWGIYNFWKRPAAATVAVIAAAILCAVALLIGRAAGLDKP